MPSPRDDCDTEVHEVWGLRAHLGLTQVMVEGTPSTMGVPRHGEEGPTTEVNCQQLEIMAVTYLQGLSKRAQCRPSFLESPSGDAKPGMILGRCVDTDKVALLPL